MHLSTQRYPQIKVCKTDRGMIWRNVVGYDGLYEVSSDGVVRSLPRVCHKMEGKVLKEYIYLGKVLTPSSDRKGYQKVKLYKDGKGKVKFVHRLVLEAFRSNHQRLPQINHINEDKSDNRLCNLEWCSASYNVNYGKRNKALEKPVEQMTKDMVVIGVFKSTCEASRKTGVKQTNISQNCLGKRKSAGGYIWHYLSE